MKFKTLVYVVLFVTLLNMVSAQTADVYVSNSGDWQDVYSVMQYASLNGKTSQFLVSTRHSTLLINQLNSEVSTRVITSSDNPYVVGYKSVLQSREFNDVEEERYSNVNLGLANELPSDVTKFLILDDSYGYNAISVAP